MEKTLRFPKNFLWGTATSAYQVEGGNKNCDWAKLFDAGKACDHYNRYEEDFELAKSLNQNAYRFSIEWSRIEPKEGKFDQKEIEHYREFLKALKVRDMKVMATLHHFTNPLWLAEIGGWTNKKVVFYFSRFAQKMFDEYKDLVDFWITINEPLIYGVLSYFQRRWPSPETKTYPLPFYARRVPNFISFLKVLRNQILAHKKIYETFHQAKKDAKIGIAKNNVFLEPANKKSFLDVSSVKICNYFWNQLFLNKIKNHLDFIGLNYYFHNKIKFPFRMRNENKIVSDLGWEIYPEGIYHVLKDLKKYNLPIYITENGIADKKDKLRKDFIKNHLRWVWQSIQERVDVKGYFHWSLIDNFEWDLGFEPRFGLVKIDYKTLERKPRPSAFYYSKISKENAI